jgi:hypothetical protein
MAIKIHLFVHNICLCEHTQMTKVAATGLSTAVIQYLMMLKILLSTKIASDVAVGWIAQHTTSDQ